MKLFKFPKDPEEFRKWEKQVQRTRSQWVATSSSHLCSEHFGKEYFEPKQLPGALVLKLGAVPTVFVRPHCSSCNGVGCSKCLPAIQRRGITAEPKERAASVSGYYLKCRSERFKQASLLFTCIIFSKIHTDYFSSKAEYNETASAQFDETDGGGDKDLTGHLTGEGVMWGGGNKEVPGEAQKCNKKSVETMKVFVCPFI